MGESYLNRIIKTGSTTPPDYVRLSGVPNGESIIANAQVINSGGTNYYPIYYMCLMDTVASESFTIYGTGVATGADAYVFSDDLSTLHIGDTTHTFNVASDFETSEYWKCRYVIAYATETNKDYTYGITVNLNLKNTPFEFIGSQYLKLSNSSALFGNASSYSVNQNLRYVNLSSSSFYNNTISVDNFCRNCGGLNSLLLPNVTTISGNYFCSSCMCLMSLSLPELTTISGTNFCSACGSLKTISFPALTTLSGSNCFSSCRFIKSLSFPALITLSGANLCSDSYGLEYFEIPNTVTSITNTSTSLINYTQFIKLPTDFDIDACNFSGITGYTKSLAWFTHLATQLKDNSSGSAKTMILGSENIALIPTATATIISNKNWTLS